MSKSLKNQTVTGCDVEMKVLTLEAVEYYMNFLLSPKLIPHVTIDVTYLDTVEDSNLANASVIGYNTKKKPRHFLIQMNKSEVGVEDALITLAHECVHVKQYIMNEMSLYADDLSWLGHPVHPDTDYYDYPWEIEAYGRSVGLYWRFVEKYKLEELIEKRDASTKAKTLLDQDS